MSMDNQEQYQLLKSQPQQLLTIKLYQDKLKQVVLSFAKKGFFKYDEVEDVIQEVNELFLTKKLTDIQNSYNPKFGLLIHYFSRAVYNKCVDISKKRSQQQANFVYGDDTVILNSSDKTVHSTIEFEELLMQECNRLTNYLRLFPKHKSKLILLLKLYSRIILIKLDLVDFYPNVSVTTLNHYLSIFGLSYYEKTDKLIYQEITPLINEKEQKKNTDDALRKWFQDRLINIIETLNKNSKYSYDKESLKNLLQIFFKSPSEKVKTGI